MKNESRVLDSRVELTVPARDDYPLGCTLYDAGQADHTVVIFGATAVPQSFYDRFARYLASEGLRVLTFDYRGVGRSRPGSLRGFDADMTEWATLDAGGVLDWVRRRFGSRFAFVGHSFGGQLIGILPEARNAAGAVLTGAQLGYYGHWPALPRARLAALWHVAVPALVSVYGYLPGRFGLGTDLPRGVAVQWARWCRHPDYLGAEHRDAAKRFAAFRVPTAFLSASDDDLAPPAASRALLSLLPRETVVERILRPEDVGAKIGHFGFYRPAMKDTLWTEIARFLRDAFDGRTPRMDIGEPPSSSGSRNSMPSPEEILLDLSYGRP